MDRQGLRRLPERISFIQAIPSGIVDFLCGLHAKVIHFVTEDPLTFAHTPPSSAEWKADHSSPRNRKLYQIVGVMPVPFSAD